MLLCTVRVFFVGNPQSAFSAELCLPVRPRMNINHSDTEHAHSPAL